MNTPPVAWFYKNVLRPALFEFDAETIHDFTLRNLARLARWELGPDLLRSFFPAPPAPIECFGLVFPNPIGLAAGLDKSAAALPMWEALGFGFCEVGAVTLHGQPGNPRPRIFRIVPDEAIINRMGFNNPGAAEASRILEAWKASGQWPRHPVGINLGKSRVTPLEEAAGDYCESLRMLWSLADFFVVNVSSPNTPNLRKLEEKSALDAILAALQQANQTLASLPGAARPKPLLLKISPDLSWPALDEILELAARRGLAGIVATNTTVRRPENPAPDAAPAYAEAGGLSGRPLRARSTEVIAHIYRQSAGRLPIIGSGGIFSAADAWEKIEAGASLLQIYTGFIYEGPGVIGALLRGIREQLAQRGFSSLQPAVGSRSAAEIKS